MFRIRSLTSFRGTSPSRAEALSEDLLADFTLVEDSSPRFGPDVEGLPNWNCFRYGLTFPGGRPDLDCPQSRLILDPSHHRQGIASVQMDTQVGDLSVLGSRGRQEIAFHRPRGFREIHPLLRGSFVG